jgi:hypothetical protein
MVSDGGMRGGRMEHRCAGREMVPPGGSRREHVPPDLHERPRDALKSWYTYKGPSPSLSAVHASESPSPDGELPYAVPVLGP